MTAPRDGLDDFAEHLEAAYADVLGALRQMGTPVVMCRVGVGQYVMQSTQGPVQVSDGDRPLPDLPEAVRVWRLVDTESGRSASVPVSLRPVSSSEALSQALSALLR